MTEDGTTPQRAPTSAATRVGRARTEDDRDLEQAQRLAALGRLALGAVHDFKNALTCVLSFNELAASAESTEEKETCRREIESAAQRATRLTQQILSLGGKHSNERVLLDIDEQLRALVRTFERIVPPDITVRSEFASVRQVRIDPVHFGQLILNLATNARDAMPNGGTLSFESRDAELSPARAASLRRSSGDYVELIVRDSGAGMNTSVLNRVYEPFFTTKSQSNGTGLGMSVVRQIVDDCHGKITIDTDPGRGTTVRVLLPAARSVGPTGTGSNAVDPEASEAAASKITGSEHILLVDRDPAVRRALRRGLERLGYEVTSATNPATVQEIDPRQLDFVVAPSQTALDRLLKTWSERAPQLRGLRTDDPQRLAKPFTPEQLANAIRLQLDETA